MSRYSDDFRCRATETALAVATIVAIFLLFALTTASVIEAF